MNNLGWHFLNYGDRIFDRFWFKFATIAELENNKLRSVFNCLASKCRGISRMFSRRASSSPVNIYFELTYAQYLTVPRSVMQAMPHGWQCKMVALLEEMDQSFDWIPGEGQYWVELRDEDGDAVIDPLANYRDYRTLQEVEQRRIKL